MNRLLRNPKSANFFIWLLTGVTAVLFGINGVTSRSHDLGVYFAGAASLNIGYDLYATVIDHKGPLLYLYLQAVQLAFGYSVQSASIALGLACFLWLGSIVELAKAYSLSTSGRLLISGIGVLTLQQQGGNSIVALLTGALAIFSLAGLKVGQRNELPLLISVSLLGSLLLPFIRIDGLALTVLILGFAALQHAKNTSFLAPLAVSLSLVLPVLTLFFFAQGVTADSWWFANVQFGLFDYGSIQTSRMLPLGNFFIALTNGFLPLTFLLGSVVIRSRSEARPFLFAGWLFSSGLVLLSGKDTNYYLFPFFIFTIFGLVYFINSFRDSVLKVTAIVLAPLLLLTYYGMMSRFDCLTINVGVCLEENASSSKSGADLSSLPRQTAIMVSDGWPWIQAGVEPNILFSPDLPASLGYFQGDRLVMGATSDYEFFLLRPETLSLISSNSLFSNLEKVADFGGQTLYRDLTYAGKD